MDRGGHIAAAIPRAAPGAQRPLARKRRAISATIGTKRREALKHTYVSVLTPMRSAEEFMRVNGRGLRVAKDDSVTLRSKDVRLPWKADSFQTPEVSLRTKWTHSVLSAFNLR